MRTIVQVAPSYHLTVLARQALGADGDPTNALIALVVITIVIAAATLVIYRRTA